RRDRLAPAGLTPDRAHRLVDPPARCLSGHNPGMSHRRRRRKLLFVGALLLEPLAMKLRGYPIGGNLVVRCRSGHLFTSLWLPGVSLRAVRLGWWRIQRCPVGKHWSIVTPVRVAELSDADRQEAARHRDTRLP